MQIGTIRKSKKMRQEDLAAVLQINRSTIAKWETGKNYPNCELLPKIAKALGCTIDELFNE